MLKLEEDAVSVFEAWVQAKAHKDEVRDRLVKALRLYELPQELRDLADEDAAASEAQWEATVAYEVWKAKKGGK